jgi:hypothetical protein
VHRISMKKAYYVLELVGVFVWLASERADGAAEDAPLSLLFLVPNLSHRDHTFPRFLRKLS